MARRRWKCTRVYTTRGYQKKRSRSHRREFVRGGADPKIRIFNLGNKTVLPENWEVNIGLVVDRARRISHFTLEAIRISMNRNIQKTVNKTDFHLRIRVHPHDIYREHTMMSFAGADRLSSGMRNGFGRPTGRAARVKAGTVIMECGCKLAGVAAIKKSFETAGNKICCATRVILLNAQSKEIAAKVPLSKIEDYVHINA
jgi:large subunit ribosomal protein L10e